jgi:diguanylate cyclase (GGDEF)-like protein
VWTSVSAVLERLWELVLKPSSEEQAVSDILASLLDACGFSRGAAYLFDGEGALWLRARFGFSDQLADGLRHFWGRQRVLEKVASGGEPVVLTRTSAPSGGAKLLEASKTGALVLQPLSAGTTPVGVLMMACDRGDPPAEALVLARSMAGPISQAVILARSIAHVSSSQRQLATVTRAMSDGLLEVDPAGIVRYANAPAIAMLGLAGDVTGLPLAAVAPQIPQRPGAEVCHLPAVHGPDRQIEVSGASFEDPSGASGLILTLRDVSSRMAPEEIGRIANHDPLTGLFNRRRLEEELSSRLAESRRYQTEGALLALSLDRLAAVRDTYGQASADAVVRGVADVLRAQTREVDVIARKGGDEIVLLLNHAGREGALVCAAKVRDAIRGLEVTFAGRTLKIGVSIGVALFPDHGTQPEEILGAAEQALRTAQKAGRDGVHLHSAPPPPP